MRCIGAVYASVFSSWVKKNFISLLFNCDNRVSLNRYFWKQQHNILQYILLFH